MGIFKRIQALEEQNIALAKEVARLKSELHERYEADMRSHYFVDKKLEAIEKKLPEYEDAVARGVDDAWNKALESVVNFNPFKRSEGEA